MRVNLLLSAKCFSFFHFFFVVVVGSIGNMAPVALLVVDLK